MWRKIDDYLTSWRKESNHKPLIISGARQVGKTYSVRRLGEKYQSFIEVNFVTHPQYKHIFELGYDPDSIAKSITFINPEVHLIPGDTLIFFDEMQEYPDCATSLKFFCEDGRYDVICSGSMMGLHYGDITSNSVGYKTDATMYSLDFEEFLVALGYGGDFIEDLLAHMVSLRPYSELQIDTLNRLFIDYVVLGGMPDIVASFVAQRNFSGVLQKQQQLLADYDQDITKYAVGLDKARIRNVYRNIPVFLAKENKKFQVTKLSHGARNREYGGCVEWLVDAGIVKACYCLNHPELPLKGNYNLLKYKLYFHDSGLLIGSLDDEASTDLRQNRNFGVYKGAIYENVVAEALTKQGFGLYYYQKEDAQLEMDFFVRDADSLIPIEVKSTKGDTTSLNRLIKNDPYPDIRFGIKLCRQNIGFNGTIYTFPYACAFLLRRWLSAKK